MRRFGDSPSSAEPFAPAPSTRWLGRAWRHLPSCGSTSDEAAAWARGRAGASSDGSSQATPAKAGLVSDGTLGYAPHGAVVTADAQTRGRGRLGRAWHSPSPSQHVAFLYFSAVLRPPLEPRRLPPLVLAAGVALAEAVELATTPLLDGPASRAFAGRLALKWPNDLLLDGKKVAGILTELTCEGSRTAFVVVGIGVNVAGRASDFPVELEGRATSLSLATGRAVSRRTVAERLAERLESWADRFVLEGPAPVVAAWKARAPLLGRPVEVSLPDGTRVRGVAETLDDDGALVLRLEDGRTQRVVAGELAPA